MVTLPSKDELKAAFKSATFLAREYITSAELARVFNEIRDTHKLHFDEAEQLSIALNAVFLEVRPAAEFSDLLKVALEQNRDKYDAVLRDLNEKVFRAFRGKMRPPEERIEPSVTPPKPGAVDRLREGGVQMAESAQVKTLGATGAPDTEQSDKKTYATDPYREPIE